MSRQFASRSGKEAMNKRREKILICGASIAGPCLAYWLVRAGFQPIVIERAKQLRDGGHNIDIHGAGRKIVERMNLLDAIKSHHTSERGMKMIDADGNTLVELAQDPENDRGLTKEIEILRGDLAKVFFDATKATTEYRFSVTVKKLVDRGSSVAVEFSDGTIEDFDLVISAEGVGSPTRKMVMDELVKIEYLGMWMGFFRIPKIASDGDWAEAYWSGEGTGLVIRPATEHSRGVLVAYKSDGSKFDYRSQQEQKETIREALKSAGGQSIRVAENLDYDDDLYLGPLSQVKAECWSKGRFALVGDAGYSPSIATGKGTTLAITGAYVLARELSKTDNIIDALKAYESILRPFAEECQKLPPGYSNFLHPSAETASWSGDMADIVSEEVFFAVPEYNFD